MKDYEFNGNEIREPLETGEAPSETMGSSFETVGRDADAEFSAGGDEFFAAGGAETFPDTVPEEERERVEAEEIAEAKEKRKRRQAKKLVQKMGYLVASTVAVVMLATAVPEFASDFKWGSGSDAYYADTVTAIVCDAVDRSPVQARMTFTDANGRQVAAARADSEGRYSVNLPEGEYTVELSASGYVDDSLTFYQPYEGPVDQVFAMSAELRRGQMRIVLQWGDRPSDLDSHLFGASRDNAGMHVFYSDMFGYGGSYDSNSGRSLLAMLDVDDTSSYGPETITIYDLSKDYIYAVYDYSSGGSLSSSLLTESAAVIKVYTYGSDTPRTFTLPRGEGTWWHVFRIRNGAVRPINELSTYSPTNGMDMYGESAY